LFKLTLINILITPLQQKLLCVL